MRKNSLISVVIPFYGRKDWLIEALKSVLNQTYKDFEIIVVDDGNPEDLTEVIRALDGKIRYIRVNHSGRSRVRNIALENANGDYIAFLDADDIWLPDKLEKQIKFMESKNLYWSHHSYKKFHEYNKKINYIDVSKYKGYIFYYVITSCPIATPCVMLRSELIKLKNHKFDTRFEQGEDTNLWANISLNYNIGAMKECLALIRIRGSNAAKKARIQIRAKADMYDYFISKQKCLPLSKDIVFIYKIISWENNLIKYFEIKVIKKELPELIARLLYGPLWAYLKLRKLFLF